MAADITKVPTTGRRQDVFVVGNEKPYGQLWHAWDDGKVWHDWEVVPGGGLLTSAPAAAGGDKRIDVYARGTDNQMYHIVWLADKGWQPWEAMGGGLASGPAVCVPAQTSAGLQSGVPIEATITPK